MIGNVSYMVENKGSENETFDVLVTDNRGLLTGQTSFTRTIATGESQEIIFQVQGSSEFKTVQVLLIITSHYRRKLCILEFKMSFLRYYKIW